MLAAVERYIKANDIKGLRYIFADSLDVDPTFEKYNEDYEYCKGLTGFFESYEELTKLTDDSSKWNKSYWTQLKMDLMKNFSEKRFEHMKKVAKVIYSEKIERLIKKRNEDRKQRETINFDQERIHGNGEKTQKDNIHENHEHSLTMKDSGKNISGRSKQEEEDERIRKIKEDFERKREAEEKNKKYVQEVKNNFSNSTTDLTIKTNSSQKKGLGLVVAAAVIVILIIIITR